MLLRKTLGVILTITALCSCLAFGTPVLDGWYDTDYGTPIATDPTSDLASPGPADWVGTQWSDLENMYAYNSLSTLYIYLNLRNYSNSISEGQIGLTIDVNNTTSGGTNDPWGNAITCNHANSPDYYIRGNIVGNGAGDNGWTELRTWDGSDWDDGATVNWGGISGGQVGTKIAYADTNGVEIAIPFTDLGLSAGDVVYLQFYTTQGGGSKGAYDTIPTDDQSTGWDDSTTHVNSSAYTIVPEPGTVAMVMFGGLVFALHARRRRRLGA